MEIKVPLAKETLEALKRLQALDTKIRELKRDLQEKPKEILKKKIELQTVEGRHNSKMAEIKDYKKKIDSKELDLKAKEEEIRQLEIKLNTVKTNKEYSAIVAQVNSIKADNSLLEEEILQCIDELDRLTGESKEVEAEVRESENVFEILSRKNREEKEALEKQLAEYQKSWEEISRDVDKTALEIYTRVLESKEGLAIVPVRGGICQGCYMKVTTNEIAKMMKGDSLSRCRTCARILFLE